MPLLSRPGDFIAKYFHRANVLNQQRHDAEQIERLARREVLIPPYDPEPPVVVGGGGGGSEAGLAAYLSLSSSTFSSNTIDWTTELRAYGSGISHSGVTITLATGGFYLITLQAQIGPTSDWDKYVVISTGGDATDPVTFLNTRGTGDSTVAIHGAILDYYSSGHAFACITDATGDPLVSAYISVARLLTL